MVYAYSLSISLIAIIVFVYRILQIGKRPSSYPPGPPTIPILGNIHQLPQKDPHKQFQKWAEEYGPVYSLMLGTKTLIVLSSDEAVKDLLDKRGAITSDRVDMYMGQTLCSGGKRQLLMHYGPTWRMIRKLSQGLLNGQAAKTYLPYQMLENKQMLFDILEKPEDVLEHFKRFSNSLSTVTTYGWRTPRNDDPKLLRLFEEFEKFGVLSQTGTAAFADYFPILQKLPDIFVPAKALARQTHIQTTSLYVEHWLNCKEGIKSGTANPCFCIDMARVQQKEGFDDKQAAFIAGGLLEAGSDTTASTLYGFLQAMVLFPEVQKAAQEELDRVVGVDRLPTMEDEFNLQYIRGCVKESLRWMPSTIMGAVPHATMEDITYNDYKIPKGAGLVNNVYTIHYDTMRYPEPKRFNPDRYKDDFLSASDSAANPDASKRDHFTFGAGRRICGGMHLAERSLFLGISRLLWAFKIEPALDKNQKPIIPDPSKLTQGLVCLPETFPTRIIPRDEGRARIIRENWQEAQVLLDPMTKQWKETPSGVKLRAL